MKVTFYSNFLNHHQLPFCQALNRLTDGNFIFVATKPIPRERLAMGYCDMNKQYPFVLTTYDNEENHSRAMNLAKDSDVIIVGSAPDRYISHRLKYNKLTFRYSERLYKKGFGLKELPRALVNTFLHHNRLMHRSLYMLCASAYTAADCAIFGNYIGRTYKWGYFPEVKLQCVDEVLNRKRRNCKPVILWAGRLISWKHPEEAIRLADRLKANGIDFELRIIGDGVMSQQLKNQIADKHLCDYVHMLGSMSPESVRNHMEEADIFLFTSDFNEGWGAVLNESMNSMCAVVASHAIGSVPFLLENGKNGFIYRNGNADDMYARVIQLIQDRNLRETIGTNAYLTLSDLWNADEAAKRFLDLAQALLDGKSPDLFVEGPCSFADVIKNEWF